MEWIPTLRRHACRVRLHGAEAEILSWAHAPHLSDNVLHRHTYFEVCTVGRWGSGTFTLDSRAHAIGAGDTFFARPGEIHRIQNTPASPRPMELFWVAFVLAPGKVSQPLDSLASAFSRSSVSVRAGDADTLSIWQALEASARSDRNAGREMLENLSRALLLSILQGGCDQPQSQPQYQGPEDEHGIARLSVRYIHDNLSRRLPVEEVAAHVHTSPRHLARLFRAFTGTSPANYVEAARIQRARHLLGHERASIKQAASAVGYPCPHHFTRAFTRRVGVAPGAFRDQHASVIQEAASDGDMV